LKEQTKVITARCGAGGHDDAGQQELVEDKDPWQQGAALLSGGQPYGFRRARKGDQWAER
jgi:hypothetical protein